MLFLLLALSVVRLLPAEWPQFRGPTGQGHSDAGNLPLQWSESENIAWKTDLPGLGWSSPVISDGSAWLTTAADDGLSLRAIRIDIASGEILKNVEVFRLDSSPSHHDKNSHASPTPVLEPNRVYVHFGPQGTAALDAEGKILWRNQEHTFEQGHGTGGSPVISGNHLIFNCDGTDRQSMVALDKNTGITAWRTSRKNGRMGYSTPLVISGLAGDQVISTGGDRAVSYDAASGREIWWITYDGFSLVPRPVHGHGLVYLTTGFFGPTLFAIRPDGTGDITGTSKVAWEWNRGVPLTSSPVLAGDSLYMVSDNGIATCLDAKTGKQIWRNRLGGNFSASPLHAGDRIYFLDEDGKTTVIRAGHEFERLGTNEIEGRTLASLSVAEGSIFLRSDKALYRIKSAK